LCAVIENSFTIYRVPRATPPLLLSHFPIIPPPRSPLQGLTCPLSGRWAWHCGWAPTALCMTKAPCGCQVLQIVSSTVGSTAGGWGRWVLNGGWTKWGFSGPWFLSRRSRVHCTCPRRHRHRTPSKLICRLKAKSHKMAITEVWLCVRNRIRATCSSGAVCAKETPEIGNRKEQIAVIPGVPLQMPYKYGKIYL